MGAEVRLDPAGFGIGFKDSWRQAIEDVERRGRHAVRHPGRRLRPPPRRARLRALGRRGRRSRSAELGVFFDTIVVCSVTGSTHAGMIAGFAAQDRPRRVIGIDASAKLDETRDQVERIARRTAELIGLGRDLRDDEITVLEGWAGDLYGIPVQSTLDAIRLTGQLEGMIIDPVYEGKSMAGLHRPGARRPTSASDAHRALRAPRRPAGAERLQRPVHPHRPGRPLGTSHIRNRPALRVCHGVPGGSRVRMAGSAESAPAVHGCYLRCEARRVLARGHHDAVAAPAVRPHAGRVGAGDVAGSCVHCLAPVLGRHRGSASGTSGHRGACRRLAVDLTPGSPEPQVPGPWRPPPVGGRWGGGRPRRPVSGPDRRVGTTDSPRRFGGPGAAETTETSWTIGLSARGRACCCGSRRTGRGAA